MREAFIKLHISILLAGFTGLFGKLVTLNEGLLVWYRMLLAAVMLFLILWGSGKLKRVPFREVLKIAVRTSLGVFLREYQGGKRLDRCGLLFAGRFFYGVVGAADYQTTSFR
jgi:hypothetical protein